GERGGLAGGVVDDLALDHEHGVGEEAGADLAVEPEVDAGGGHGDGAVEGDAEAGGELAAELVGDVRQAAAGEGQQGGEGEGEEAVTGGAGHVRNLEGSGLSAAGSARGTPR